MATMFSVTCMMCGRVSGQVLSGRFQRAPGAPPPDVRNGRTRCGFCFGNLYLEPDDSLVARPSADFDLIKERRLAG